MRIISGSLRGRRFDPAGLQVRPTTDMAKESLFNILNNLIDFEETRVLDLFSGTGSMSYEFISRGCPSVVSVEMNPKCHEYIRSVRLKLGLASLYPVRSDAFRFITSSTENWDLIFADPPYDLESLERLPDMIFENKMLAPGGRFILEHSRKHQFTSHQLFEQQRHYGKVHFSFFKIE